MAVKMWKDAERVCFGKKFCRDGALMFLLWRQEGAQCDVEYQDWAGGNPLNKRTKPH